MKKTGDILLTAKAFNGRIICSWLADTLQTAAANFPDDFDEGRLSLICVSMTLGLNNTIKRISNAGAAIQPWAPTTVHQGKLWHAFSMSWNPTLGNCGLVAG